MSTPLSFTEKPVEEDDVAFVALDVLEVLDEKAFTIGSVQGFDHPLVLAIADKSLDSRPLCWLNVTTPSDGVALR